VIVFSEGPIAEELIAADDNETFVGEVAAVLASVGWEVIGAVGSGLKLEATSPQGLKARCTLTYANNGIGRPVAKLTMMSADESVIATPCHVLMFADQSYRVWANQCQMFVSLPGYADNIYDSSYDTNFACGIPHVFATELGAEVVEGECGIMDNAEIVTEELWWTCGGGGVSGTAPATFRWSLTCDRSTGKASWNHTLLGGFGNAHTLRIFPTRHGAVASGRPSRDYTRWADGEPIFLDPYVGWGDSAGNPAKFRGQLYDAFLASFDQPLDDIRTTEEPAAGGGTMAVQWRNYTHSQADMTYSERGSYNGSLYLRRPGGEVICNYAY